MGVSSKFVIFIVVLLLLSVLEKQAFATTTHAVGGSDGWDESTNFDNWASSKTFKVGDELEFKYSGMHSVVELANENAYKSCDVSNTLKSFNGGDDKIKLDKPGTRFFACGTPGHCDQGMKVKITTVATAGASSSPSSGNSATTPLSTPGAAASTSASSHRVQFFSFSVLIASSAVSFII